jgi:hypothetical protein
VFCVVDRRGRGRDLETVSAVGGTARGDHDRRVLEWAATDESDLAAAVADLRFLNGDLRR